MADLKKCEHKSCSCIAPAGKSYCSQICEDSKDLTTLKCDCEHSGCKGHGL
ncbi:hypothetical protein BH10ACI4_BH10ACI4_02990 [soil metagenome]